MEIDQPYGKVAMAEIFSESDFYRMITSIYHVAVLCYHHDGQQLERISPYQEEDERLFTVTRCSERLRQQCAQSGKPQVIASELNQVWAGVPVIVKGELDRLIIVGPVYTSEISQNLILNYARSNQLSAQSRAILLSAFQQTPIMPYVEFTRLISMLYYYFYHEEMDISLLSTAAIPKEVIAQAGRARAYQKSQVYEENLVHATYAFEQYMLACIREGQLEKLKRHLLQTGTHGNIGSIGNNDPVRQQKNTFICAVTLATREAVEGGLSPEAAYSLSDLYIQQVETMKDVLQIMTLSEAMLYDYATRVSHKKHTHHYSKLVNDCCNFIDEHVHENLRVTEVAAFAGFSPDYVSKKFREETGRTIGDYIRNMKISEAKSLLQYSELALAEISELLSFSTQSFFTSVFKQVTGVTPRQYREQVNK